MKRTIKATFAAVPLLAVANLASAGEPVQLTDHQMDGVTAGGSAFAEAVAQTFGAAALSSTTTSAVVELLESQEFETTVINTLGSMSSASSLSDTAPEPDNGDNGGDA